MLPNLDPARQAVIREVLQILQEELSVLPTAPRSENKRHRLSASSLTSINNSLDSLHVQSSLPGQQIDQLERRASISCCENLPRNLVSKSAPLAPRPPHSWETVSSSSLAVSSEAINSNYSMPAENIPNSNTIVNQLNNIIKTATEAIAMIDPSSKTMTRTPLIRKTTFNVKDQEDKTDEGVRKKARVVVPTPAPRSFTSRTEVLRNRAPKPPVPTPTGRVLVSTGAPKTDPIRRRTYNVSRDLPRPVPRAAEVPPPEQSDVASSSKVSKSVALFKRLGNAAANAKKKHPDTTK